MARPDTEYPACPEHGISMVPRTFDTRDASLLQGTVEGFRCPCQEITYDDASHTLANEDNFFVFLKNLVVAKNETHILYQLADGIAVTDIRTWVRIDVHIGVLEWRVITNHLRPVRMAIGICPCAHGTAKNTMYKHDYCVGIQSANIVRLCEVCTRINGRCLRRVTRLHQKNG